MELQAEHPRWNQVRPLELEDSQVILACVIPYARSELSLIMIGRIRRVLLPGLDCRDFLSSP